MSTVIENQDNDDNNNTLESYRHHLQIKGFDSRSRYSELKESIFILCETCYWCATWFNKFSLPANKCPQCSGLELSSFPILSDEALTFEYNERRGTQLSFGKRTTCTAK